jgi:excisionase family DNA binding protein
MGEIFTAKVQELEKILDVPAAALALGVSKPTLRKFILEGRISGAFDLTPESKRRTWRIPESSLDKFIEQQVESSASYLAARRGGEP